MAHEERADYLPIAVFARLDEAEVARGLLESEGIPAALLDAQLHGPGLGPAADGVRLLVPAWDEARAKDLLSLPEGFAGEGPTMTPLPLPGGLSPVAPDPGPEPDPGALASTAGAFALHVAVLLALALGAVAVLGAVAFR
jgi:hypothetical protein